jgi:hypothetical protein
MLQIKLEWDPSASLDVVEQQIHFKFDEVDQTPIVGLDPTVSTVEISAEDNTNVEWFVRTIDDAGNQTDSDPTVFTATDTIPPAPATGLRATTIGET